jgi:hypothetical protein
MEKVMDRSLVSRALALALASTGLGLTVTSASVAGPGQAGPVFECDGTYTGKTFKHVVVPEGATCILRDSVVTGNFRAKNPRTVKIIDTEVRRNTMIRGASRDVIIGNAGCGFDPLAGNNIKVTNSHNVAICWMTVKNNVMVRGNDGRITLMNNDVGRNIDVSRNHAYRPGPGDPTRHKHAGAIRIKHNTAGGHIHLFNNHPSRTFRGLGSNTPAPEVK